MPRLLLPIAAVAAFTQLASAGIAFSKPTPGDTLTAGQAIQVAWAEGGTGPKIADLLTYQLFLIAGGDTDAEQYVAATITTAGAFTAGNVASGMVATTAGENTPKNAYFLKMVAVGKTGGQLITYSDRFSYSGMAAGAAVFPANIKPALAKIKGTAGPPTQDKTAKAGDANPAAPDAAQFEPTYTMQTGATRYAPMQPVPPTKVTATNTKPLYPTSSVSIAKSKLPPPDVQTTITASQTFSVNSRENTVAAAVHATDDMGKFLNRWKD